MTTKAPSKKTNMEDKIDELQMKCFAMLGTIKKLKEGSITLDNEAGVKEFYITARELLKVTNTFFRQQPPQANE